MLKRFFPSSKEEWFFCGTGSLSLCVEDRFRCLRRSLLITMLLIAMIPLCLTAGISFYQYRRLVEEEMRLNAGWSAANARQAVVAFVEKLQTAVMAVSDASSVQELADQERLDKIFAALKAEHKGLVDLSLIRPDGVQAAYAGPYDLAGKDYSGSPWYNQALARKVYVSEVFMGFRNVPHFVIAVSRKESGGYWLLRASIDTQSLDRFLASVSNEGIDDIFLINGDGVLQSSSRHHGPVNTKADLELSPKKSGITVEEVEEGTQMIRAAGYVQGTPWLLVQEQQGYFDTKSWLAFRNQLGCIILVCLLLAGYAAYSTASFLAASIRKSDESREIILHETEHTNKLASIGRLAAGVAHEINNPLAIISEKAGLMKDLIQLGTEFPRRDKFLSLLDALENAVSRSRVITHRLLGFARRMEVSLELLDIREIINEVLVFLEKEAADWNIAIEKYFQADLPAIRSDRGQLQQIFLNIINNAIDAVGENGEISIATHQTSRGAVQVDISDNGPGIQPEITKKIFEPFFTTKKNKNRQGTGLGLSITYGLVKKLGGEISVRSEANIGATFSLIFPVPDNQGNDAKNKSADH